jgi:hypothetical protein
MPTEPGESGQQAFPQSASQAHPIFLQLVDLCDGRMIGVISAGVPQATLQGRDLKFRVQRSAALVLLRGLLFSDTWWLDTPEQSLAIYAAKFTISEILKDPCDFNMSHPHHWRSLNSEDFKEGRRAFMEKRKPRSRLFDEFMLKVA